MSEIKSKELQPKEGIFIPVKGFEGLYLINRNGQIKQCEFTKSVNGTLQTNGGKIIKPFLHQSSYYLRVVLYDGKKKHSKTVLQLLLSSFYGVTDKDKVSIVFKDGNPKNVTVGNITVRTY